MAEAQLPEGADKRGYLLEPYRLFHLKGKESESIVHHYHEFHKMLLFLSGSLSYRIEGRSYTLRSGDLLLIPAHAIHQPIIDPDIPYERILLWIQPDALAQHRLDACFDLCQSEHSYLLARERYDPEHLISLLNRLEEAEGGTEFGDDALSLSLFLQTMVYLNRCVRSSGGGSGEGPVADPRMDEMVAYINDHLGEDLSANALGARFFMSRSWLTHRFKELMGCTLHQYVTQKRMILAAQLLRGGATVGEAARQSGFGDYSTFLRAFRRVYGVAPRDF